MKLLTLTILTVMLAGCASSTDMIQHGNEWIQLTQSNNFWKDNVVVATRCWDKGPNGFCEEGSPTQIVVMSGKGAQVVGAGIQGVAILGGSAIIGDGLKGSASKTIQKNNNTQRNDVRASTVNPK